MTNYVEEILEFGSAGSLRGVLVEPSSGQRHEAPAILTWNVGLNHQVGTYRFFVDLTRALAALGFTSLRFDLSGWGDSELAADDERAALERAVAELREAMATLTQLRGFQSFVPIGFCSGVDAAHVLTVSDARVVGVVHVEGYGYRTRGFYLRYWRRFVNRDRWERLFRLKVLKQKLNARAMTTEDERSFVRHYPSPQQLDSDLSEIVARGVRLLLVYVGGDTDHAYREQLLEIITQDAVAQRLELEFYPDADHALFLVEDRRRVVERIGSFMREHFGITAAERIVDGL